VNGTGFDTTRNYLSIGTFNFAPGVNDSMIMFYEAPALQPDIFRFDSVTASTVELKYRLKYLPDAGIQSSLGTGGIPKDKHYLKYRDLVFNIFGGVTYLMHSEQFENGALVPITNRDGNIAAWMTFRNKVVYFIDADEQVPMAEDFVHVQTMEKDILLGVFIGGISQTHHAFGEGFPYVNDTQNDGTFALIPALGEKNSQLFMVTSSGFTELEVVQQGLSITTTYNLVGRPLVK